MKGTQQMVEVAQSLQGCSLEQSNKMVNFFNDSDNTAAIAEAFDKFGTYPPKNRASYKNSGLFGRWNDFCDFDPIYEFYCYAKISSEFPKPANNNSSCYKIKSALVGLETVKANAILSDAAYQKAIEIKISELNSIYSRLSCDQYIINQEKRKLEEASIREQKRSSALQADAFDKATGTIPTEGSKKKTYILYGFSGLSAIVFIIALLKGKD